MEAKKTKHDMAEYDRTFLDRMMQMMEYELAAYLHTLTPAERQAMEAAMYKALSQRVVADHHDYLEFGLMS